MVSKNGSCTFGLILEQKVVNMEKSTNEIKIAVNDLGDHLNGRMTELFNHQSTHVPESTIKEIKTQWKIVTIITSLLGVSLGILGAFTIAFIAS